MTEALLKAVVSPAGRIELEVVDGDASDHQALARLIAKSDDLLLQFIETEDGILHVHSKPSAAAMEEHRKEGEAWLKALATGGAFDFWDNESDNAIWG